MLKQGIDQKKNRANNAIFAHPIGPLRYDAGPGTE
jgi:hypothetical protein